MLSYIQHTNCMLFSFFVNGICHDLFFEKACMLCYGMLICKNFVLLLFFTDKNCYQNFMPYKLYVNIPYVCYGTGG